MAEGNNAFLGLAVPLNGNFEVVSDSTTLDILTLTQVGGGTGDFIVCQTSDGSEVFIVEDGGAVTVGGGGVTVTSGGLTVTAGGLTVSGGDITASAGDVVVGDGYYLRFSSQPLLTTKVTTGLTAGDFFPMTQTSIYYLGFKGATSGLWTLALSNN
jgi:hypothetical protein